MATWKRIFTEDDVSSVNISNTNLTSDETNRTFFLASSVASFFQIGGTMLSDGVSGVQKLAVFRADNAAEITDKEANYAYFNTLRVGKPGQTGFAGSSGYKFPSVANTVSDGEVMVSKSFNASTGELNFATFGEWMKPTGDGIKATASQSGYFEATGSNAPDLSNDSVLIMDDTNDEFAHHKLINMPRSLVFDFSHSSTEFSGGENFLRSAGFVQGGTSDASRGGVMITSDCKLHKVSFRYKKEHSTSVGRAFRIYKNNILVYTTNTIGASNDANTVVRFTQDPSSSGTISPYQTISFSAGDELDVSTYAISGQAQYFQITLEFITNA